MVKGLKNCTALILYIFQWGGGGHCMDAQLQLVAVHPSVFCGYLEGMLPAEPGAGCVVVPSSLLQGLLGSAATHSPTPFQLGATLVPSHV